MKLRSSLGYVGILFATSMLVSFPMSARAAGKPMGATKADSASRKVSKVPKCGLVGSWRGNITIPDGADGVSTMVVLQFSESGHKVALKGAANDKPLAIANATTSCTEFSFVLPQGHVPVTFSGKLSDDGQTVSGSAKRQDLTTSWSLRRP